MALDASIVIGVASLLIGVSTLIETLGASNLWFRLIVTALGIIISILPILIKLFIFWSSRQTRSLLLRKAILQYIFSDYYDKFNLLMWLKGISNYCNITCENKTFYRNDYIVVSEILNFDNVKGILRDESGPVVVEVDFGHYRRGCWNRRSEGYIETVRNYKTEEIFFVHLDGWYSRARGHIIVKEFDNFAMGEFFVGDIKYKNAFDPSIHMYVEFDKTYTGLNYSELRVECRFYPITKEIKMQYKSESFPEGHIDDLGSGFSSLDFLTMIKVMEFWPETGYVTLDESGPRYRRGAFIWHSMNFKECFYRIKRGAKIYELCVNTFGRPCFVEGNDESDFTTILEKLVRCIQNKFMRDSSAFCGNHDTFLEIAGNLVRSYNFCTETTFKIMEGLSTNKGRKFFKCFFSNWQCKKFLSDINIIKFQTGSPPVLGCSKLLPSQRLVDIIILSSNMDRNNEEWMSPFGSVISSDLEKKCIKLAGINRVEGSENPKKAEGKEVRKKNERRTLSKQKGNDLLIAKMVKERLIDVEKNVTYKDKLLRVYNENKDAVTKMISQKRKNDDVSEVGESFIGEIKQAASGNHDVRLSLIRGFTKESILGTKMTDDVGKLKYIEFKKLSIIFGYALAKKVCYGDAYFDCIKEMISRIGHIKLKTHLEKLELLRSHQGIEVSGDTFFSVQAFTSALMGMRRFRENSDCFEEYKVKVSKFMKRDLKIRGDPSFYSKNCFQVLEDPIYKEIFQILDSKTLINPKKAKKNKRAKAQVSSLTFRSKICKKIVDSFMSRYATHYGPISPKKPSSVKIEEMANDKADVPVCRMDVVDVRMAEDDKPEMKDCPKGKNEVKESECKIEVVKEESKEPEVVVGSVEWMKYEKERLMGYRHEPVQDETCISYLNEYNKLKKMRSPKEMIYKGLYETRLEQLSVFNYLPDKYPNPKSNVLKGPLIYRGIDIMSEEAMSNKVLFDLLNEDAKKAGARGRFTDWVKKCIKESTGSTSTSNKQRNKR
jgi:hypothetical protein